MRCRNRRFGCVIVAPYLLQYCCLGELFRYIYTYIYLYSITLVGRKNEVLFYICHDECRTSTNDLVHLYQSHGDAPVWPLASIEYIASTKTGQSKSTEAPSMLPPASCCFYLLAAADAVVAATGILVIGLCWWQSLTLAGVLLIEKFV